MPAHTPILLAHFHRRVRLSAAVLLIATTLLAPSTQAQSFLSRQYTAGDGLPSAFVSDLAQDGSGLMWFATRRGLVSYDGYRTQPDSMGLPSTDLDAMRLTVDGDGRLWCLARDIGGVNHLLVRDGGQWIPHRLDTRLQRGDDRLTDIRCTGSGDSLSLWIGVLGDGLFRYHAGRWRGYGLTDGLPSMSVYALADDDETLFAATEAGLAVWNGSTFDTGLGKRHGLDGVPLLGVAHGRTADGASILWLHTTDTPAFLIDGRLTRLAPIEGFTRRPIRMLDDGEGGCFFGNRHGLFYYHRGDGWFQTVRSASNRETSSCTNLIRDREGMIWIATPRGVTKIITKQFQTFREMHGLLESEVSAAAELPDGSLVFGHNRGLTFMKDQRFSTIAFPERDRVRQNAVQRIIDIAVTPTGTVWAAASYRGVLRVDAARRQRFYTDPSKTGLFVSGVHVRPNGQVWVGAENGIYVVRNGALRPVFEDEISGIFIRRFFDGRNGTVYAGTNRHGVFRYREGRWSGIRHPHNERVNNVYAVHELPDGTALAGTAAGIWRIRGERFVPAGLALDRPVYSIVADHMGRLWFGTDNGLYRVVAADSLARYGPEEGLAGLEANRAAALLDGQGDLWFGTNNGLTRYRASLKPHPTPPPLVHIVRVEADGWIYPGTGALDLPPEHNDIDIHIRALGFRDEERLLFRYRLPGYDDHWRLSGRPYRQVIHLDDIPYNTPFRFEFQASNPNGPWSEVAAIGPLTVSAPFYQTTWFQYLAGFSTIVFFFLLVRTVSVRRFNQRLQRLVDERTEQLRKSEKRYRELFEESRDVVFVSTPEGRFLDINPAGVALFGYESKEEMLLLDIGADLFVTTEDRDRYKRDLAEGGFVKDYEVRLRHRSGDILILLETTNPIRNGDGAIVQYRGILRDVTNQRQLEAQLLTAEKMRSLGLLAGGIAHDFNNLLSGILGFASLLKALFQPDSRHFEYADTIERSARRAAELTEHLLGFAQGGKYETRPMDLNRLIEETINLIRRTFDRAIDIEIELGDDIPTVQADPAQLQRVIVNLCINARDAMPEGGTLHIATAPERIDGEAAARESVAAGRYVSLTVRDTGEGIPPDLLKKIFDPFFTTKSKDKGTGLGLSMVYGVVQNHRGFIRVESAVGAGSTFRVFLPVSERRQAEPPPRPRGELIPGDGTILVVDDEEHIRHLLESMLERYGYRVLLAEDGLAAVRTFQQHGERIDLVILDMIMPRMNGRDTCLQLRTLRPTLPILISTGFTDPGVNINELQVQGLLKKPYRVEDVLEAVRKVMAE